MRTAKSIAIFKRMSAIQTHALSQRRQYFIKSIRTMQINNFKKEQREVLIRHINPIYEVHQLKNALTTLNIQYFPAQIEHILTSIRTYISNQQFKIEMRSCYLLQQLYDVILGDLSSKSYLEAPKLVQLLLSLTYELLPQGQYVLSLVENSFNYFIFALHRYPCHNKVLQSVAGFFNYTEMFFTNNYWQQRYQYHKMIKEQQLVLNLTQIYLSEPSYEILWGDGQFAECCDQGTQKWYKNATMMLEIVNSLMLMNHSRQKILNHPAIKENIFTGIRIYAERLRSTTLSIFQDEESQFDATSESTHESHGKQYKHDCQNYFIILLLELCLMRSDLLSHSQSEFLRNFLEVMLGKSSHSHTFCIVAVKIMKILYEQVILDDQDLQSIGSNFPALSPFVRTIINDFI